MRWAEREAWLRSAITDPLGPEGAIAGAQALAAERAAHSALAHSRAPTSAPREPIGAGIVGPHRDGARRLGTTEALAIYNEAYFARITGSLAKDFAAVHRVIGESNFRALAQRYLVACPPSSWTLTDVGRELPSFLREFELTTELPFLPDLASLEWLVLEAFYAEDHPLGLLETAALASIGEEAFGQCHADVLPSLRSLETSWPVDAIWSAREKPDAEFRVELVSRPRRLLVWTDADGIRVEEVPEDTGLALERLRAGMVVGAALASLDATRAHAAFEWIASRSLIAGWIRRAAR